jgi:hypothetical protein
MALDEMAISRAGESHALFLIDHHLRRRQRPDRSQHLGCNFRLPFGF